MRVRIIGPAQAALAWQYQVENLGEDWRCVPAGEELLLLLPGQEGRAALSDMLNLQTRIFLHLHRHLL